MSDQSPYDTLGITEDASFDEIQSARDRLLAEHDGDRQRAEAAEMAYDAILMERLRLRQEGKIKVPDRIRFPEKLETPTAPAKPNLPTMPSNSPEWLQRFVDTPSPNEILWPALVFLALAVASVFLSTSALAMILAVAAGVNLYCLHRKEQRFGRAVLITVVALIVGVLIGSQIAPLLIPQGATTNVNPDAIAAVFTLTIFWLTSSFLR